MKKQDREVLSDDRIPESVRATLAEQMLTAEDRQAGRELEAARLAAEREKLRWNTPVVAALAGLMTLSATFVFDRVTARDDTENAMTLQQLQAALDASEARLKQELESANSRTLADLESEAREREFQYEIIRGELTNESRSNAELAEVLLFLVRAGVLSSLNEEELQAMAKEQIENPDRTVVPRLTPERPALSPPANQATDPAEYEERFWSVEIESNAALEADGLAERISAARPRYEQVAGAVGAPWYVIGVLHMLELGGNFEVHLHNGDPLTARTVNMPAGRPATGAPPFSWGESAIDAMNLSRAGELDWNGLGATLDWIERYNGLGYRSKGFSSPYLWAGTNAYTTGGFVRDGVFDPRAVRLKVGAVAILRRLHERGVVNLAG